MIKIIKGVYGYVDENLIIQPKTPKDEPFSLDPEKEARLIEQGVAVRVEEPREKPEENQEEKPKKKSTKKAKTEETDEEPPAITAADPE